ncbi:hypothetical protein ACTOJ1_001635 [Shigella flexneri]
MNINSSFFKTLFPSKNEDLTLPMLQSIDRILRLFYILIFIALPILFSIDYNIALPLIILSAPVSYIIYACTLISFEEQVGDFLNNIGMHIGYKKVKAIEFFIFFLNLLLVSYSCIVMLMR